jgi:malonyl-CoA O-methyltransferase
MSDELAVDKRLVRRSFERAAERYDASAVLQREVCGRMLARLEYIKARPDAILDAGSGTGNALTALIRRYPHTPIVALDLALGMLKQGRRRLAWWQNMPGLRPPLYALCADIEQLPLANGAIGLIWCNLTLQWANDLRQTFADMYRVLSPGGLLMFSTFGPDTLRELRRSSAEVDGHTHVNRFVDMHDIGDLLVNAGYADPVMDMETFTLTYDDILPLMRDLKAIGAHNVTRGRPGALSGRSLIAKLRRNYEAFRRDGKLPATFEVVYGHAWKPEARTSPTGRRVIDIKPRP